MWIAPSGAPHLTITLNKTIMEKILVTAQSPVLRPSRQWCSSDEVATVYKALSAAGYTCIVFEPIPDEIELPTK